MTREEEIRARLMNGNTYAPSTDDDEIYVIMQRDDVVYLLDELDKRNKVIKELHITLDEIAHLWKESCEQAEKENANLKGQIGGIHLMQQLTDYVGGTVTVWNTNNKSWNNCELIAIDDMGIIVIWRGTTSKMYIPWSSIDHLDLVQLPLKPPQPLGFSQSAKEDTTP